MSVTVYFVRRFGEDLPIAGLLVEMTTDKDKAENLDYAMWKAGENSSLAFTHYETAEELRQTIANHQSCGGSVSDFVWGSLEYIEREYLS